MLREKEREMNLLENEMVAENGEKSEIVSKPIVSLYIYGRPHN
jgi:hypothetical protein